MVNAFKAIRRAELIKGGFTIKQGEIFTLGFQLYDSDGVIIIPTVDQTISVKIANLTGVIYETNATVVENHIEFTVDENLGYGQMNVELKVTEGTALIQKYPADDFIKLKITKSLDDANVGNITAISAEQMRSEISAIEVIAGDAKTTAEGAVLTAESAEEIALDIQGQLDSVVNRETDSDAMSRQAAVNSVGVDKFNLKARLDEDFNSVSSQLAETGKKLSYKEKQTNLYAKFYQKLRKGTVATLACVGDSMTYGLDKVSADIRAAKIGITENGKAYYSTDTLAAVTYPESLQEIMNEVYGTGKVTVMNKGFSGDGAKQAFENWNVNTDLALLSLGINDAINSNTGYAGNLDTFLSWYRKLIEKHLDGNCGVIIMTPVKSKVDYDIDVSIFRQSIFLLAKEYGIPVVEGDELLTNINADNYSDGLHMNGKGYKYLGRRIASIFIGKGISDTPKIKSGDTLNITEYNSLISKAGFKYSDNNDLWSTEGSGNKGTGVGITATTQAVYYSVYCEEENLLALPISLMTANSKIKVEIDFSEQMPQSTNDFSLIGNVVVDRTHPLSNIEYLNSVPGTTHITKEKMLFENPLLFITTRGWHTIKITSPVPTVVFEGLNFMSLDSYKLAILARFSNRTNISYLTHTTYTDTSVAATMAFDMFDIARKLQVLNTETVNDYWKHSPVRIKVHIYDQSVVEYLLQIGNNDVSGVTWRIKEINRVEFVTTPQVRTIDSLTYNNTTKLLTLNFGGATNKVAEISFSA